MAYIDFPEGLEGQKKRKAFFLSEDGLALMAEARYPAHPDCRRIYRSKQDGFLGVV